MEVKSFPAVKQCHLKKKIIKILFTGFKKYFLIKIGLYVCFISEI